MKYLLTLLLTTFSFNISANDHMEVLYGLEITDGHLVLLVKTHGCTNEDSFKLSLEKAGEIPAIAVERTKPDRCRKRPSIKTVKLPLQNLTVISNDFMVANRFSLPVGELF